MNLNPHKILLVPDGFGFEHSGYALAVFVGEVLQEMGFDVGVFSSTGESEARDRGMDFYSATNHYGMFARGRNPNFALALSQFQAKHVFVIGVAISKDPGIFDESCRIGANVVGLWLIQDFFCVKNWAVRDGKPCSACSGGDFYHSVLNGCKPFSIEPVKRSRQFEMQAGGIVRRTRLRKRLLKLNKVIGTGDCQLDLYRRFGFRQDQLIDCPFFYDRRRVTRIDSERGGYFVFLGQHSETKGWTLLSQIMDLCPDTKFTGLFYPSVSYERTVEKFGFSKHIASGQLRVVTDVTWGDGAEKYVAEAAGVVNPSLWESTTETVLLESLGLSKPVIVFDVGVHKEYFENRLNGCIAKLGDIQGFAEAVRWVNSIDNDRYRVLSSAAKSLFDRLVDKQGYFNALAEAFVLPEAH